MTEIEAKKLLGDLIDEAAKRGYTPDEVRLAIVVLSTAGPWTPRGGINNFSVNIANVLATLKH